MKLKKQWKGDTERTVLTTENNAMVKEKKWIFKE